MTIPSTITGKVSYLGDGTTKTFPVPFIYFADTNGNVYLSVVKSDMAGLVETTLTQGTDFTITSAGEPSGTITLQTALTAEEKLTVTYNVPYSQLTDYEEFGRLPSESIEKALDLVTMLCIQLRENISRCVKVGVASTVNPDDVTAQVARVYDSIDNVDTVATDKTNLDTVAEYIDNVITAAQNIQAILNAPAQAQAAANSAEQAADIAEAFDENAAIKTSTFNENAATKTETFNTNASEKTSDFDSNATSKTNTFNSNASAKQTAFDDNAASKTSTFNTNASGKTSDFNANAAQKQAAVDSSATSAAQSEANALDYKNAAAGSATSAATSETNALASKNAAATSATNAANSETAAAQSATSANSSKTDAANSASSALQSKNAAATSEANALSYKNTAVQSATNAATSETNAANSATVATQKAADAEYWAGQAATGQVQADWTQTDSTKKDFIKNKPTKVSQFANDAAYINKDVNNLTNYTKTADMNAALANKADKSTTYTKTEVDGLVAIVRQSLTVSTTWTAVSGGGYSQTITAAGITANDTAKMELVQSADYATAQIEQVEYAKIYKAVTGAGSITLYADEPTTSTITINIIK